MQPNEIDLPETKPETEWVRGRALQKVSPTPNHSFLQGALVIALTAWAEERGKVGPEWRFRITPPDEPTRPLVPDVAFVRNERLRDLSDEELEASRFAPDIAVEILSPGDRRADIEDKVRVYLASGTELIILVNPRQSTVELLDRITTRTLHKEDTLQHPALPDFSLPLTKLFAAMKFK